VFVFPPHRYSVVEQHACLFFEGTAEQILCEYGLQESFT
jgi:hypothetical protein